MNQAATQRQEEWQAHVEEYRKRELDELLDMARTCGEIGKVADDIKAGLKS